MDKIINFNETVYASYSQYPEIVEILDDLGFHDIVKPGVIQTAGRFMTINKGAAMKKISIDLVKKSFIEHGFIIQE